MTATGDTGQGGSSWPPFATLDELKDALHDLNYVRGIDTAGVLADGYFNFFYCTDPDGEWFFENTDPRERMVDDGDWQQYERLSLDSLSRGPYTIIWPPAV